MFFLISLISFVVLLWTYMLETKLALIIHNKRMGPEMAENSRKLNLSKLEISVFTEGNGLSLWPKISSLLQIFHSLPKVLKLERSHSKTSSLKKYNKNRELLYINALSTSLTFHVLSSIHLVK